MMVNKGLYRVWVYNHEWWLIIDDHNQQWWYLKFMLINERRCCIMIHTVLFCDETLEWGKSLHHIVFEWSTSHHGRRLAEICRPWCTAPCRCQHRHLGQLATRNNDNNNQRLVMIHDGCCGWVFVVHFQSYLLWSIVMVFGDGEDILVLG